MKRRPALTVRKLVRLVPITFLSYQFSLLLFAACFAVVFVVDNDCQKRNLIGTDRRIGVQVCVYIFAYESCACLTQGRMQTGCPNKMGDVMDNVPKDTVIQLSLCRNAGMAS
ncbi:unnamed protein product [Polarella glacialis]|uniref:Uncharacterized protein n=1 Tax=Polarella glacialis TaxID=89957 RepID=A0A813KF35_POLGL|nr:unnamed protein product [Polarella glacialis]